MASFEHTVTRNLQCPVCLELMAEPRQLSCSHTFCKACLASLMTENLHCPTCHQKSGVVGGDVSYLKENFPLKDLIADVNDKGYPCNVCQAGSRAICYCCDCDKNICRACSDEHSERLLNKNHTIVSLSDMRQGKVVLEKRAICKDHEPGEEEHECTDVCVTCEKFICIKCRVRNHEGHIAQSAADFKAYSASEVKSLQARAGCKIREMNSHIDSLQADRNKVVNHLDGLKQQIEEYYEDLVRILNERKSVLQMQCDKEKAKLCQTFDGSITSIENLCESIKSASYVAGKATEAPLKTDTIATYYSSRRELNRILNRNTLVISEDPEIFRLLQTLYFEKNLRNQKELELGQVQYVKLELKRCVDLGKDSMNTITTADAFCMAVGSQFGGARIYNVEGELKRTILKDVNIRSLAAFVGGWYAVGDLTNAITVYQLGGSKCNVSFKSLSHDDGGHCGFSIDSCNNLYVSYRKAKKIYRFDPGGGDATRETVCDAFEPLQICAMKNHILVKSFKNEVRVIDAAGKTLHSVHKAVCYDGYPAVGKNDVVYIAWVRHEEGLVSIDQYTNDLKHVVNLIDDYKIKTTERQWYYLAEFVGNENCIAFCTTDRLYIFQKIVTLV